MYGSSGFARLQISLSLFLPALLCISLPEISASQHRVIGYYPAWQRTILPASSVMFQHLTHVNQAFAWPVADGSIAGYSDLLYPELLSAAHQAGRKVLISLGGWGQSDGFGPMSADSATRAVFVRNLVDYLQSNGFDGADIDWERPANSLERANLVELVKEIRAAFQAQNPDWLLTLAAPPSAWGGTFFDYAAMTPYLDWYNVMDYDTHGSWSAHAGHNCPLYAPQFETDGSVDHAVKYLNGTRVIPMGKLVIGIPFYGKEFSADSLYRPSTGCTDVLYRDIPPRIAAGWVRYWDTTSHVPYLIHPQAALTLCYDDSLSVSDKASYAVAGGLGGVMIWALGQDVTGDSQPLLEAIGKVMGGATDVGSRPEAAVPREFRLEQNFPNPFNPETRVGYHVPEPGHVKLTVLDILGREVAVLVDANMGAGRHEVSWDARGHASGVYIVRLGAGPVVLSRRMLMVR